MIKTIEYVVVNAEGIEEVKKLIVKPISMGVGGKILKKVADFSSKSKTDENYRYALNALIVSFQQEDIQVGIGSVIISMAQICHDMYSEFIGLIAEVLSITPDEVEEFDMEMIEKIWAAIMEVNSSKMITNLIKNSKGILLQKAQEVAMPK